MLRNGTSPITLQVTSSSIIHRTLTALCLGQQDITRGKNGFCKVNWILSIKLAVTLITILWCETAAQESNTARERDDEVNPQTKM